MNVGILRRRILAIVLAAASSVAYGAGEELGETLILLQHVLRDASTNVDAQARYAAWNRASGICRQAGPLMTPEQRKIWRERLNGAFNRLPPPETVTSATGLRFHRIEVGNTSTYVSEAVTTGQYAAFLTDRQVSVDRIRDQFYRMPFLQTDEEVTTSEKAEAISGLNQRAADAYREWLARREGAEVRLPWLRELPPGLRRSLWVSDPWKEADPERRELLRLYGGNPQTLLYEGVPVAEFAEATPPGVQLHVAVSMDDARKFELRRVAAAEATQ